MFTLVYILPSTPSYITLRLRRPYPFFLSISKQTLSFFLFLPIHTSQFLPHPQPTPHLQHFSHTTQYITSTLVPKFPLPQAATNSLYVSPLSYFLNDPLPAFPTNLSFPPPPTIIPKPRYLFPRVFIRYQNSPYACCHYCIGPSATFSSHKFIIPNYTFSFRYIRLSLLPVLYFTHSHFPTNTTTTTPPHPDK